MGLDYNKECGACAGSFVQSGLQWVTRATGLDLTHSQLNATARAAKNRALSANVLKVLDAAANPSADTLAALIPTDSTLANISKLVSNKSIALMKRAVDNVLSGSSPLANITANEIGGAMYGELQAFAGAAAPAVVPTMRVSLTLLTSCKKQSDVEKETAIKQVATASGQAELLDLAKSTATCLPAGHTAACTAANAPADNSEHTCGSRISWVVEDENISQQVAGKKVVKEYPAACSACASWNDETILVIDLVFNAAVATAKRAAAVKAAEPVIPSYHNNPNAARIYVRGVSVAGKEVTVTGATVKPGTITLKAHGDFGVMAHKIAGFVEDFGKTPGGAKVTAFLKEIGNAEPSRAQFHKLLEGLPGQFSNIENGLVAAGLAGGRFTMLVHLLAGIAGYTGKHLPNAERLAAYLDRIRAGVPGKVADLKAFAKGISTTIAIARGRINKFVAGLNGAPPTRVGITKLVARLGLVGPVLKEVDALLATTKGAGTFDGHVPWFWEPPPRSQ